MEELAEKAYWELADYTKFLRELHGVKAEDLCIGLCSESMLTYYEQQKKELPLGVCHRLLERLGVGAEYFQTYLPVEEYECWQCKIQIIYGLIKRDYATVEEQLAVFEEKYQERHQLEKQFFLRMRAMLAAWRGGERDAIRKDLEESLHCTLPELSMEYLKAKPLSIEEMDTLIEYYNYLPEKNYENLEATLSYVRSRNLDTRGTCKVLPKLGVYLYRQKEKQKQLKEWDDRELSKMEDLLFEALDSLRDCYYMGYLWEILDCRKKLLSELCERNPGYLLLQDKKNENQRWLTAVEWMYEQIGVEKETIETAIVYALRNVECTNDVIRRRRLMLGMTGKELAEGICDEKTIRRIENNHVNPRKSVAVDLFERLHLPRTFFKGDYVGTTPEVKLEIVEISRLINRLEYEQAKERFDKIKAEIPMEIEYNRRCLEQEESAMQYHLGKVTQQEHAQKMRETIETSIPVEMIWAERKAQYFEWDEIASYVLYLMVMADEQDEKEKIMQGIEAYYRECIGTAQELNRVIYITYAWQYVQSYYGNHENFEKSNQMCREMLWMGYCDEDVYYIARSLYALWWNKNEQSETTDVEPLNPIAALYNLIKDYKRERTKLEKIEKSKSIF